MLFADSQIVGTFKGFNERGLEFAAEIVAPYDASMLDRPQLGQFVLIELASVEEAALGRITRFVPSGLLATAEGEDYVNTMQRRQQAVPEDLKTQRLKYRVQIKLLGAVRAIDSRVIYVPSQRRLPHLGARVAFPSSSVLQELCRLSGGSTDLGDYVLGEFVFGGAGNQAPAQHFRSIDPELKVTFDIHSLVSRRSVVFARAGYGKSNLMKYLIAELYRDSPTTDAGLPVGTLIFDADGEYFWPDCVKSPPRPGLCDVPHLRDKIAVFTNRQPPSPYYGSWKIGEVKLDIRELLPRDVIGIAISSDRQEHQNVLKLKSVSRSNWRDLVDVIYRDRLQASDADIGRFLGYTGSQVTAASAEIAAARSNMNAVVGVLHDPNSRVLAGTIEGLRRGGIVVVDISLLSSAAGEMLAGLILRKLFSFNQENFTGGAPIIPTLAVIEEAQSVLGGRLSESSPFVEWAKEGRKYELGAILITQQPGAIAAELLSQSDNWFSFHLLSEGDAGVLGKYNSHYSNDILAHLIGEPIPGNCFMWSAPQQPFVLPVRIRSFEGLYREHVRTEPSASETSASLSNEITTMTAGAIERLAELLVQKLSEPATKFRQMDDVPQGAGLIGVKSGQLFYLIQGVKLPSDTTPEDSLKMPILESLLGQGNVRVLKDAQGAEFFCARLDAWERAGVTPRISTRNA
ncbi:MAG: hypothetical protein A49_06130 [Methyloceanibacter sp.]|nr:MAG: hypothetical protein A49_06130 [Methyloceanibacter sp.]